MSVVQWLEAVTGPGTLAGALLVGLGVGALIGGIAIWTRRGK